MTTTVEPERELVRRLLPFAVPALAIAAGAGAALGGAGAAWSAAIAIAIVALNFVAHAGSMAWAARISPMILMAVGLGGYVVRIAAFTVALLLLDRLPVVLPARVRRRVRPGHDRAPRGGDAAARGPDAGRPLVLPGTNLGRSGPRDRGDPRRGVPSALDEGLRLRLLLQLRSVRHRVLLQLHHRVGRGVRAGLHPPLPVRVPEAANGAGEAPVDDGVGARVRARADRAADARARRRSVPGAAGDVLLLHLLHEHVRDHAVGELLGEQPRGVPARPRADRLGHLQRRRHRETRVLRLPQVHLHHPERARDRCATRCSW